MLADTDSRWKWGVQLAHRLRPGRPVDCYELSSAEVPSPRQLTQAGVDPALLRTVTPAELLAALAATSPDVLVVALPGGGVQAVLQLLAAAELPHRPLVVTGYVDRKSVV